MNKERLENSDLTRTMLQVLFIGILIISSGWVLMPFLSSIIWAAIIVVATWPMFLWVQRRLWNRRGPAVALMSIALLLVLIIPLSFATVTVINRADDIAAWINAASVFEPPPAPGWLSKVPFVGPRMVDYWQQITDLRPEDLSPHLAPFAGKAARWFISQIGNVGMTVLQFIVTVIIAAIIYTNGEKASGMVLGFARRLAGQHGEEAAILAAKAVRSVTLGVVVTAILQALVGGVGLAVTGVPSVPLLTVSMFVLSLAQIGPVPVLLPAVIWNLWSNGILPGGILTVFMFLAVVLDNVVRPLLIKKGVDLSMVLIFAGVAGGLIAFGVVGLFIGPVLLAVTYTLIKTWIAGDVDVDGFVIRTEPEE